MARTETVLTLFLASPGDVAEERSRLKDVVDSWNTTWSREFAVRLELLRWETDAYPDSGEDGQDVINKQIPNDWDIFIGVMWSRFGTPTARAGSGTEEEFLRAIERRDSSDSKVSLLLYFKEEPVAPSKIDPVQLADVLKFKATAKDKGLLVWNFNSADEFEKLVDLHITKHVQEWRRGKSRKADETKVAAQYSVSLPIEERGRAQESNKSEAMLEDDDDGYLDLLEEFTSQATEIQEFASRLNEAQTRLTEKTAVGREELERLQAEESPSRVKAFRASIARVADEMLVYTNIVEIEVPKLRLMLDRSMGALMKFINVAADLYPAQSGEAKTATYSLLTTLSESRQAIEGFKASTIALPKMTKELNVAKRRQAAALSALITEFEHGERLLSEGIAAFAGLLSSSEDRR